MKTKILFLSAFVFLSATAAGQDDHEIFYSKDVGFNTTFLFEGIFASNQTPFSIFYKKYVSENKANRFGINISMNLDDNTDQGSSYYTEFSNASISLNFGREIQKPVNLKWIWFYGGDLVPFYSFYNSDNFQDGQKYFITKSSGFGLNLKPFLAIRYNINTRLYLSAEASINLKYTRSKQFSEYTTGNITRDTEGNNISFYATPASGLFLYYRF